MNNQTTSLEFSHFPVMLDEVLKISAPASKKILLTVLLEAEVTQKKFLSLAIPTYMLLIEIKKHHR